MTPQISTLWMRGCGRGVGVHLDNNNADDARTDHEMSASRESGDSKAYI